MSDCRSGWWSWVCVQVDVDGYALPPTWSLGPSPPLTHPPGSSVISPPLEPTSLGLSLDVWALGVSAGPPALAADPLLVFP